MIALSAVVLPQDIACASESGFARYLTKPVKLDDLTAALEDVLLARSG